MISGRGVDASGTYRSVGSVRFESYAGSPGVAVARVVSTNSSWRTEKVNGRASAIADELAGLGD
jgi:hypothetical protein